MERYQMKQKDYKAREDKLEIALTEPLAKIAELAVKLSFDDKKVMDLDTLYGLFTTASIVSTTYFLEDMMRYAYMSKAKGDIDEETCKDLLNDVYFFILGDLKEAVKENFDTITRYYEKNPMKVN